MDRVPTDTHAANVAATVAELERGLAVLPLSKAINRVDDWRRALLDTELESLVPIADDLGALRDALTGEGIDGAAVGALLVRLGEATAAAADEAPEVVQASLARLGSLLRHAGGAMAGNAAGDGTPNAAPRDTDRNGTEPA